MWLLTGILKLLENIPASFWGIVVGSFFTLGGVVLTNRGNDRRLVTQIRNDRELRAKERELVLRKEVYLAAVEGLYAGFISIGRFADLNIPDNHLASGFAEKGSSVAKVQVIANEDTARAVITLASELQAIVLTLLTMRMPLTVMRAQIAQQDSLFATFGKEHDRIIELMKQYNLEGKSDQRQWATLQQNFQFEGSRIKTALESKSKIGAQLIAGQLELAQECFDAISRLSLLLVPAVIAIRKEIELPFDDIAYRQMVEVMVEKQNERIAKFLHELESFSASQAASAYEAIRSLG